MSKLRSGLEWLLNAISIALLIVLVAFGLKKIGAADAADATRTPEPSERLQLPAVDWDTHGPSLVLVLSTECSYCTASVPLYKQFERLKVRESFRLIAAFPQPSEVAAQFLALHDLHPDLVRQVDLGAMKAVRGTPTVFLAEKNGVIVRSWSGQLSRTQESEVIEELSKRSVLQSTALRTPSQPILLKSRAAVPSIEPASLLALQSTEAMPVVIDVRERGWYRASHISGALSIPIDELPQRVPHEVRADASIAVLCMQPCACKLPTNARARTMCDVAVALLRNAGHTQVKAISTDIDGARAAGLKMESAEPISLQRVAVNVNPVRVAK